MATTNEEIIKKVNDTFSEGDTEGFLSYCADDVRWNMVGSPVLIGKDAIRESIKSAEFEGKAELDIGRMVAQGDIVVVEGTVDMIKKASGPYHAAFCDIYRLQNGKIMEMNSYVLELAPSHQD